VGSGRGTFLWVCRKVGIEAVKVEPDLEVIDVAKTAGLGRYVVRGVGEHLPFRDEAFSLATSISVIEDVREPAAVLEESLRVTSRKGAVHLSAPHYSRCFHEGHFNVFWVPLLPKRIATVYLRILGRPYVEYVDTLRYVTGREIRKTISKLGGTVTDLICLRTYPTSLRGKREQAQETRADQVEAAKADRHPSESGHAVGAFRLQSCPLSSTVLCAKDPTLWFCHVSH
jgi:hypothetical protein